jgi:hypothetical protein
MLFYDKLRPFECPMCDMKRPLRKHGTYSRYFCDFNNCPLKIDILRYYCAGCGGTVSYLPSFALPYRQFSAGIISLCLQLVFVCGISLSGINRLYPAAGRVLIGTWLKSWHYSSNGIITVLRNHFKKSPQSADICSGHISKYITTSALEAFFLSSDLVLGYELYKCDGKCSPKVSSCDSHTCSEILKGLQEIFLILPFSVRLL